MHFFTVIREAYSLGVNLIYCLLTQDYMNMACGPVLFVVSSMLPCSASIKTFLNFFFPSLIFFKLTENPGLMQAEDTGLLLGSLLSQMDLKLFFLKVLPACFILHFIMFYSTGLLITQNLSY